MSGTHSSYFRNTIRSNTTTAITMAQSRLGLFCPR